MGKSLEQFIKEKGLTTEQANKFKSYVQYTNSINAGVGKQRSADDAGISTYYGSKIRKELATNFTYNNAVANLKVQKAANVMNAFNSTHGNYLAGDFLDKVSTQQQKQNLFQTIGSMGKAIGTGVAGSYTGAAGFFEELMRPHGTGQHGEVQQAQIDIQQNKRDLDDYVSALRGYGYTDEQIESDVEYQRLKKALDDSRTNASMLYNDFQENTENQAEWTQKTRDNAVKLQKASTEATENALYGKSYLGNLLVQYGVAGGEMLADMLVGTATGGGSMLPMLTRIAGMESTESYADGGSMSDQLYQATKGVVREWVSEKLAGANPIYDKSGKGILTTPLYALANKLGIGEQVTKVMSSLPMEMNLEGLEEVSADYLDVAIDAIVNAIFGEDVVFDKENTATMPDFSTVATDYAVGALLGGTGNAISATTQNIHDAQTVKEQYGDNFQSAAAATAKEAYSIDPTSKFTSRMNAKANTGSKITPSQYMRLLENSEKALTKNDSAAISSAVGARLSELGETGDVSTIASGIAAKMSGAPTTFAEDKAIRNSEYAKQVQNELSEKKESWVQSIETERVLNDYESKTGKLSSAVYYTEPEERTAEEAPVTSTVAQATMAGAAQTAPVTAEAPVVDGEAHVVDEEAPVVDETEAPVVDGEATAETVPSPVSGDYTDGNVNSEATETVPTEDGAESVDNYASRAEQESGIRSSMYKSAYLQGDGQSLAEFDTAAREVYKKAYSGVPLAQIKASASSAPLNATQIQTIYNDAVIRASSNSQKQTIAKLSGNTGNTTHIEGHVQYLNGSVSGLSERVNDKQRIAYKTISDMAAATGVNVVFYDSRNDKNLPRNLKAANGAFDPGTNAIYIDLSAGLGRFSNVNDLSNYTLLRTFSHELTHFAENWSPSVYNEFRRYVFECMDKKGQDVDELILEQQKGGLSYDRASREVISEAMTDIMADDEAMRRMSIEHTSIFKKILEALENFIADLKKYFSGLRTNTARAARAVTDVTDGSVRYMEDIASKWADMLADATSNYQSTLTAPVAETEVEATEEAEVTSEEETEVESEEASEEVEETQEISPKYADGSYIITISGEIGKIIKAYDGGNGSVWYEVETNEGSIFSVSERNAHDYNKQATEIEGFIATIKTKAQQTKARKFFYDISHYNYVDGLVNNKNTYTEVNATTKKFGNDTKTVNEYRVYGVVQDNPNVYQSINKLEYDFYNYLSDVRGEASAKTSEEKPSTEAKKPVKMSSPNNNGGIENGAEADNGGAVRKAPEHGERAPRLHDELETEAVQGDGEGRDTVSAPDVGGEPTGRDDHRADEGRTGRSGSEGDSESGDLRLDGGLTEEGKKHIEETVSDEIEHKSTVSPKGGNFVIGESLDLPTGVKARYKANVEAIRLVLDLEATGRIATPEEQVVLSKYVGWGGIDAAFDARKSDWAEEYAELKELLSDAEYRAARASTKNAHYTEISVIKAMYKGLYDLGFRGGRMLEPSAGVGNFVGAMPEDMSNTVKSWTMVELDNITGLIAKHLYPNADVRIQGFEKANIPDNYMDVAIGNVPFGNYAIVDKSYPNRVKSSIHNYFFAKTLDKVRPGGIVMFITSRYTMDAQNNAVRQYISERANLLGAIRLPNTAFKGNAGTDVTTDIIILQKRAGGEYEGEKFVDTVHKDLPVKEYTYSMTFAVNEYFANHPEMVLGTMIGSKAMYGGAEITVDPNAETSLREQIESAFKNIKGKMSYPAVKTPEQSNFAQERETKKKRSGKITVKNGKAYQQDGDTPVEISADEKTVAKIESAIKISDAFRTLVNALQQGQNKSSIAEARKALNEAYDSFVKKYGYLNAVKNAHILDGDPDKFAILALENYDPKEKTATKADIFTKDTISPNRTETSAASIEDGIVISMNRKGTVDAEFIAGLVGDSTENVTRYMIDNRLAYKQKDGSLLTPTAYLSGNVRAKLREAEAIAPIDKDFQNNVDALKSVVPEDIPYDQIFVNPGTPWIPDSIYTNFAEYMLGVYNGYRSMITIKRTTSGVYTFESNPRARDTFNNRTKWATKRRSFLDIYEAILNSSTMTVKDKMDDGSSVVNQVETAAVNEKKEQIEQEFRTWIWSDETRRTELERLYNDTFNAIVTPVYDGSGLSVNGFVAGKTLRPHQANAVQRVITSGGNTLLAHRVGAGKTLEMASSAMKLRELGIVKKPMFIVPKSLVAQWGKDFLEFYPAARLLVADDKSFTKDNRKVFTNRIANGDYDAIILSYEQFEKVPLSDEYLVSFYQEQIDEIIAAIDEEKAEGGGKSMSIKQMEKLRSQLEAKVAKLTQKKKDDDNIVFENLGVDSLFVDEAHNFKNLMYTSRMTNISGLGNKNGSQKAFDLYTKVRYLQGINGGRGIVFATATPVMNSMSEMYIMQRYLQPDLLKQLGIDNFDGWAKQFGEIVNGYEIAPSGTGYRMKQSFSRFKNVGELQSMFRSFSDVLTEIPGLRIPKLKGGKIKIVESEPSEYQKDYIESLVSRADKVKSVSSKVDNMLLITTDGRKISYTQRMIDPLLPVEEGSKVYNCCEKVYEEWKDSSDTKGTQIIFCDLGAPGSEADLYAVMKERLVEYGIPSEQIAFIHDADTDKKKSKLFDDVNSGKVRVLIGSTGKMGVGMNVQKKLVAIHHLDAPWRPGDIEQRDGRAFRQGNENAYVSKYQYVTTGSFDSRLWDIIDRKQNFINQVMNGENVGREVEDTGDVTLSAAEIKAVASGSPLIIEHIMLQSEISKLKMLKQAHAKEVSDARRNLATLKNEKARGEDFVKKGEKDISARKDTYTADNFSVRIGNSAFSDRKEAGAALATAIQKKTVINEYVTLGSIAGFDIRVIKTEDSTKGTKYTGALFGENAYGFSANLSNPTMMFTSISSVLNGLEATVEARRTAVAKTESDISETEKIISSPFAKEKELSEKQARFDVVSEELYPKNEQNIDELDDDEGGDVQYQRREDRESIIDYLNSEVEAGRYITTYKAYALIEGQLFPPMASYDRDKDGNIVYETYTNENGKTKKRRKLRGRDSAVSASELGRGKKNLPWIMSEGNLSQEMIDKRPHQETRPHGQEDSPYKFYLGDYELDKTTGKTINAAYNPYQHSSNGMLNDQFDEAHNRPEIVVVECRIVASEIDKSKRDWKYGDESYDYYTAKDDPTKPYFARYAKNSTGEHQWKSGPIAGQLNNFQRSVFMTRWIQPVRIVPNDEVARHIADIYNGENSSNIRMYWNTMNPEVLSHLDKLGVPIDPYGSQLYMKNANTDRYGNEIPAEVRALRNAESVYKEILDKADKAKTEKTRSRHIAAAEEYYNRTLKPAMDAVRSVEARTGLRSVMKYGEDLQYQRRGSELGNWDVLSLAAEKVNSSKYTDAEKDALRIFTERLAHLNELTDKRSELGTMYKEQNFTNGGDKAEAEKTLARMKEYDRQIENARESVLKVEQSKVLQDVLAKARKVIEAEDDKYFRSRLAKIRGRQEETAKVKKYRSRIESQVNTLKGWLTSPNNKDITKHVPIPVKQRVGEFLLSIDFTSKRQLSGGEPTKKDRTLERGLSSIRSMLYEQSADELYSGYYDLPDDFHIRLNRFIDNISAITDERGYVINRMNSEQLKELSDILKTLKTWITNMNRFHNNAMFEHVSEAGQNSIDSMKELWNIGSTLNVLETNAYWTMMRPAYAFERFGQGGISIYRELIDAQAKLARNTRDIKAFSEDTYTTAEVKAWESELHEIELSDGSTITMTTAQIMSLYEIRKREHAQEHISGYGIRVAPFKSGKAAFVDSGHNVSYTDVDKILDELTDRQIEVADKLQRYMQEKGGEWIDHVTVARFGDRITGEPNYFPIESDRTALETKTEDASNTTLYALLNKSFTKPLTEHANNRIVVKSIFDVFSGHMSEVAQYNALALPVLDAIKWLNYNETELETMDKDGKPVNKTKKVDSVKNRMALAYGRPVGKNGEQMQSYAEHFVSHIIKAFSGTEDTSSGAGMNAIHTFNRAQVAYNLRVALQQPTSIMRAGSVISYGDIVSGLTLSKAELESNYAEMLKYSGIALWKDLGFYDVNISRGLSSIIKRDETAMDKFSDAGMSLAERMDKITWAAMWRACKISVSKENPSVSGEDYYKAVASLFDDVIYKTQVVDSVLTKPEFLRSKQFINRFTGSFMSEPMTAASMVADEVFRFRVDSARFNSREAWNTHKSSIMKAFTTYALAGIVNGIVTGLIDAIRDDDDYESFFKKLSDHTVENIIDELIPFGKYPIASELYNIVLRVIGVFNDDVYGYDTRSPLFQFSDYLINALEKLKELREGDTNYTGWYVVYNLLKAASAASGVAAANIYREVVTAWNNTVARFAPSLKLRTYYAGAEKEIKWAYQDGTLSYQDAVDALVDDADYTVEGATAFMDYQKLKMDYPDIELSDVAYASYIENGLADLISVTEYDKFRSTVSDFRNDEGDEKAKGYRTKKDKVLEYINSMKLSTATKDALYYSMGYSEKTIKEAPWH